MNSHLIIFLFTIGLWTFLVVFFRNLKMDFFKFLVGSLGLFAITIIFFKDPLEYVLIQGLSVVLNFIGSITNSFHVINEYGIIIMEGRNGGILNMLISYQCSGVIELLVFTALATFFPFLTVYKKINAIVFGNLYLFAINIIRILFIIGAVKLIGIEVYEFTHIVLARILFFGLTVILYYKVFTLNQLKLQKVGEVR